MIKIADTSFKYFFKYFYPHNFITTPTSPFIDIWRLFPWQSTIKISDQENVAHIDSKKQTLMFICTKMNSIPQFFQEILQSYYFGHFRHAWPGQPTLIALTFRKLWKLFRLLLHNSTGKQVKVVKKISNILIA